ncbi:MAG: imelysin family protein [Rhodobacterales bacterium]|nr:imelysin family protein [Rhodobacterales bacterium]
MRALALSLLLMAAALPARADVEQAVADHILPGHARFAQATAALDAAAAADCSPRSIRPALHSAWDAWMGVAHLRLGPVEDAGRALAISYWPDPKGAGVRALAGLLADPAPALAGPAGFAQVSVAARGFPTLERLAFGAAPGADAAAQCAITRAVAADLARMAAEILADWQGGFADLLLHPGTGANARYLTAVEARQALFTQAITALDFTADQRLGRPLGSFDRPRPERAEARASGRSLRHVQLTLAAVRDLARALAPLDAGTEAALDRATALAAGLRDPILAGVQTPAGRLKVEILQQAVRAARDALLADLGPALGVGLGFNAADGD